MYVHCANESAANARKCAVHHHNNGVSKEFTATGRGIVIDHDSCSVCTADTKCNKNIASSQQQQQQQHTLQQPIAVVSKVNSRMQEGE